MRFRLGATQTHGPLWLGAPLAGVFVLVGLYFMGEPTAFVAKSVTAELSVLRVDEQWSDENMVYRPVFETTSASGETLRFAGNVWVYPKPHEEGDVVPGRVDWTSGEIRSFGMIESTRRLGALITVAGFVGAVIFSVASRRKKTRGASG